MQTAQNWARTQLTHKFPDEYRRYYRRAKKVIEGSNINSRAQSRAKTQLVHKHLEEYRELYRLGISNGFPCKYIRE